jgi:alpha-galactosidase
VATLVAAAVVVWLSGPLTADDSVRIDDAYVEAASDGRRWDIGNRHVVYQVGLTSSGELEVLGLGRAGGPSLVVSGQSDAEFAFDDVRAALGGREFRYLGAEATVDRGRAVLTLGFALRSRDVVVERHYAVAPGSSAVEMWTTVDPAVDVRLNDPDAARLEVRGRDAWWQRGHETPDDQGGPFSRRTARVDDGARHELGSVGLSSLDAMPWVGVGSDAVQVVTALAWSGTWRATLDGTADGTRVAMGLPGTAILARAGSHVEFPHAVVAVTGTGPGDLAETVGAWLLSRREGRRFPALATYNTWFTFGTEINDALMRREMLSFAAIGGELFQLDAGWYPAVDARDRFDFTAGLGSWRVDDDRFPDGLGVLSDHAHELGLKFGVWVEPERVDMAMVGRPGLAATRMLAQADGAYQPGRDNAAADHAQICLGDDEAWTWVRDRLVAFLDEARPDYVKFDLNGWVVCTRDDHAHGRDGGNFAHVTGLYRLIDALRARYPNVLLENVSGGARRLDPELLTRMDVTWMDDRSAPAARVRHHVEELTRVLPPAALLSYVMTHPDEPMMESDDLKLLARSRMPGVMGLTVDFRGMSEGDHNRLAAQIDQFTGLRGLRGQAFSALLTDPVGVDGGGPGWDVLQQVNPQSGVATLYAFRNANSDRRVRVTLVHLRPETTYRIRSLDRGALGTAGGDDLMTRGFDIDASDASASQVFVFEPQ